MKNEITAGDWRRVLLDLADTIERHKDLLNELDGMAGDGDHGVSLSIGYRAVRDALASLDIATIWRRAAEAAETGAAETAKLMARIGRASRLGERSIGVADAGATSMAITLRSIASSVERLQHETS